MDRKQDERGSGNKAVLEADPEKTLPVKKGASYFTGARGDEKVVYSQSYYKGAPDKTTVYEYKDGAIDYTTTYKDTTERTDGVKPTTGLGAKTQVAYYTGIEGEEMMQVSQEYSGEKGKEAVKTTTVYTYNNDDSMKASVTYKQSLGITDSGNKAVLEADPEKTLPVKKGASYFTGARGDEKVVYSQSYYKGAPDKTSTAQTPLGRLLSDYWNEEGGRVSASTLVKVRDVAGYLQLREAVLQAEDEQQEEAGDVRHRARNVAEHDHLGLFLLALLEDHLERHATVRHVAPHGGLQVELAAALALAAHRDHALELLGQPLDDLAKPTQVVIEAFDAAVAGRRPGERQGTVVATDKVGRNEPCPCGSGKKYKKCHGELAG